MRNLFLAGLASLTLAACMTPTVQGDPLVGSALEARLDGQVLSMTPDFPELGTPVQAKLFTNKQVELTYGDGSVETFRWRVQGQGLCFSGRADPNEYFCRNVVVGETGNVANVYDTAGVNAQRIATGTLRPI